MIQPSQTRVAQTHRWVLSLALLPLAAPVCMGADPPDAGAPFFQATAGVHFDTTVSEGPKPIVDIVKKAKAHGIQVAIITDRDHADIRYGVPLLRGLVGYTYREQSIRQYGVERYLSELRAAEQGTGGILVVPGAECLPFYYWEEDYSPGALASFDPGRVLKLKHAYRHLLAIGMPRAEDYENIPSVATGFPVKWTALWWVLLAVYVVVLVAGGRLFVRSRHRRGAYRSARAAVRRKLRRALGFLIALVGLALTIGHLRWLPREYDAYDTDAGTAPVQAFIDYVNSRGGMVFWAHPEVEQKFTRLGIEQYTPAYPDDLLRTQDYAGFAIFWEGMRYVGLPGGIWDQVLTQFCAGERTRPVWALGELDYEEDWDPRAIEETLTILLLPKRSGSVTDYTHQDVLDALRGGKMYAARNFAGTRIRVDDFSIAAGDGARRAYSGDTLDIAVPTSGHLRIRTIDTTRSMTFEVLRDGIRQEVFSVPDTEAGKTFDFTFKVDPPGAGAAPTGARPAKAFYRVLGRYAGTAVVATNPIFVGRAPAGG